MTKQYHPLTSSCLNCKKWPHMNGCDKLPFWLMPVAMDTAHAAYVECTAYDPQDVFVVSETADGGFEIKTT